jgi:hypothetical protein
MKTILLAVLVLAATSVFAGDNLLRNPELKVGKQGLPASWTHRIATNCVATCDVVQDAAHGRVLHIRYETGPHRVWWNYRPAKDEMPFTAGVKYRVTAWLKCQSKNRPPPRLEPYLRFNLWAAGSRKLVELYLTPGGNIRNGDLLRLDQAKAEVPWTKVDCVFTAPASTAQWGLEFASSVVTGDFWLGGLSLSQTDAGAVDGPFAD